jgi:predicted TIM-barrel fold metal-dependent hydrolase
VKQESPLSRRQFLERTSAGLAAAGVAGRHAASSGQAKPGEVTTPKPAAPAHAAPGGFDLKTLKSLRIWDCHCHMIGFAGITAEEKADDMIKIADRVGVERMVLLTGWTLHRAPGLEGLRDGNNEVFAAVKHAPNRFCGYAFMDPNYMDACLEEIERCIANGPLVGMKFEFDTLKKASSTELDPIFARAAELNAVILHHTWIKTTATEPDESTPMELAETARRHPKAIVVCGHTGGTWELGIRAIRDVKNMYCDVAGSDPTAGFTEMAVRELGAERVLYGSDVGGRSFASQLGKVMGADITESARRLIMGGNQRRLLGPILKSKGITV